MDAVHFLTAEELSAVAHPLRQQILGLLVQRGELSGREIKDLLLEGTTNPYYHLDVLREAGLVHVVRRAQRRGSVEKFYAAVARTFSMDPGELVTGNPRAAEVRTGILTVARSGAEAALGALARSLEPEDAYAKRPVPFVNLCTLRLPEDRAQELRARMKTWLEDVAEAGREESFTEEDGTCVEYTFYQLFFATDGG